MRERMRDELVDSLEADEPFQCASGRTISIPSLTNKAENPQDASAGIFHLAPITPPPFCSY